jgi:hypothetical protein
MEIEPQKHRSETPFFELTLTSKVRRILVAIAGGLVLAVGFALIVLPGPAVIAIPAGLAILAMEFPWARRALNSSKKLTARSTARMKKWFRSQGAEKPSN